MRLLHVHFFKDGQNDFYIERINKDSIFMGQLYSESRTFYDNMHSSRTAGTPAQLKICYSNLILLVQMEKAAVSIFAAKSQKVVIGLVATTWTALLNTFILNA